MKFYVFSLSFSVSLNSDGETEFTKQQKKISSLKEQLAELEKTCSQLNQEIKNKHQALFKGKEERDKLRYEKLSINVLSMRCGMSQVDLKCPDEALFILTRLEERNIQVLYESKLRRKNQVLASRSNKLKRFGDNVPDLLGAIAEAYATGCFLKRPVGPIGNFFFLFCIIEVIML